MLFRSHTLTMYDRDTPPRTLTMALLPEIPAVLPPWCLGIPSTQPTACRAPGQVETRGFLTTGPSPGAVGSASLAWCPEGPQQPRYLLKTLGKPIRKLKQTAVSHGPKMSWEREVKDEPRAAARGAGGTAVLSWSWAALRPAAVGQRKRCRDPRL